MSLIVGTELQSLIVANAASLQSHFIDVRGGTYAMGAMEASDAEPLVQTRETLSGFRMGKYPVTVGEYRALVDRLRSHRFAFLSQYEGADPKVVALGESADAFDHISLRDLGRTSLGDLNLREYGEIISKFKVVEIKMPNLEAKFSKEDRQPIVDVNWFQSVVHALLCGAMLATEFQWEYAATCGGKYKYGTSSGDLKKSEAHYGFYTGGATAEVGSHPVNEWGLGDMTGNVWEWCRNWDGPYVSGLHSDPVGSVTGQQRVARGGAWNNDGEFVLRADYRYLLKPKFQHYFVGFRLVAPGSKSEE